MKLLQRFKMLAKTILNDVFGEDEEPLARLAPGADEPSPDSDERMSDLLAEAQARLDMLHLEAANAAGHARSLEQDWQQASTRVKELDARVDAALQAGQDEQARQHLEDFRRADVLAHELGDLAQTSRQLAEQLRLAAQEQQERLVVMHHRLQTIADRERHAQALEELLRLQREQARQTEALQAQFRQREEQIAWREDRLATRQELNRPGGRTADDADQP
ncbi:MAG: hypothetical protein ACOYYS_03015 [Chloroflexota bacterium]